MAAPTTNIVTRLSPVNFASKQAKITEHQLKIDTIDENSNAEQVTGQAVAPNTQCDVTCVPFVVEFRRLLQSPKFKSVDIIPGVANRELLHAVVALYDVCLPDITPEVLYDTVAGKGAKTIILIRDPKEVLLAFQKKRKSHEQTGGCNTSNDGSANNDAPSSVANGRGDAQEGTKEQDNGGPMEEEDQDATPRVGITVGEEDQDKEDKLVVEEKKGMFVEVFSDTESEGESESEDEDEDFSKGVDHFLKTVQERREKRNDILGTNEYLSTSQLGIENRIVACATWEKSHIRPGEKITQIDLIAVRKRFRKLGIGKHLIQNLKDTSLIGLYDSLVVYADLSAVDFFACFGFSDDIVLNSKFSELADNWTNCQLMCYLPPYTGQTILYQTDSTLDLKVMELEIQKWSEKSRESYQAQYGCLMRLRHEVIALRALVSSQQELIESMSSEMQELQTEKFHIEKDYLQQKIKTLKDSFSGTDSLRCFPDNASDYQDLGDDDDIDTNSLIQQLERSVSIGELSISSSSEDVEDKEVIFRHDPAIDEKVADDFKYGMILEPMLGDTCMVTKTTKADLSSSVQEMLSIRFRQIGKDTMITKLYFCGTLEHPEKINCIMRNGFSDQDMSHGDYGVGLYFNQHPSKAAHFSALGKMLLVEVELGKTESIPKPDRTRTTAPPGYHSIITPGRLSKGSEGDSVCQEFVIFDPLQAKPLCLIDYVLGS